MQLLLDAEQDQRAISLLRRAYEVGEPLAAVEEEIAADLEYVLRRDANTVGISI